MATKKVAYTQLLKEALSDNVQEFDTTKTIDTTGPMTKQILSYKGDGELKTTSDAASILERYYFKDTDAGVEQIDEGHLGNELDTVPSDNINKTKKDMEKDIVEAEDVEDPEESEDGGDEATNEGEDLTEAEEAVIERLISEMEDDSDAGDDDSEGGEDLDVDEEMSEGDTSMDDKVEDDEDDEDDAPENTNEAAMGPLHHPHDAESYENLEEAFKIFREEIEEDAVEIDDDDVQV